MKTLLFLAAAGTLAAQTMPFAYDSPEELFSTGDFNGDGNSDAILVDRASGTVRTAIQQSGGGFIWSEPSPTGIAHPSLLTVGKFHASSRHSAAVSAPVANLVNFFDLQNSQPQRPIHLYASWVPEPQAIAAHFLDGALDDMIVHFETGTGSSTDRLLQATASDWNYGLNRWSEFPADSLRELRSFQPSAGGSPRLGFLRSGSGFQNFVLRAPSLMDSGSDDALAPVPVGEARWTSGFFAGADANLFTWLPGGSTVGTAAFSEPAPGDFALGSVTNYNLGTGIVHVIPIPESTVSARLAVVQANGSVLIYDWNGTGFPSLAATLTPPAPGEKLRAILPLGFGNFIATHGAQRSTGWRRMEWDGSTYTATASGSLPAINAYSAVSNVVFLSSEPFVDPYASVTGYARTGDWTVGSLPTGMGFNVNARADLGLLQGLGGGGSAYREAPAGSIFCLVNQYSPAISLFHDRGELFGGEDGFTFAPPPGTITLTPPPGTYEFREYPATLPESPNETGLWVTLRSSSVDGPKYWRPSPGHPWTTADRVWLPWAGVQQTFTFQAYVGGFQSSPITTVTYTLTAHSGLTPAATGPDTDNDGLPDAWESAFNATDPDADDDGDGSRNLEEYTAGTDPHNSSSHVAPLVLAHSLDEAGPSRVLELRWPAADPRLHLEYSTTLTGWNRIHSDITVSGGDKVYRVDMDAPEASRYLFRVVREGW